MMKKAKKIIWEMLDVNQAVVERLAATYKECGVYEVNFAAGEDVKSTGVIIYENGSKEAFVYEVEGCEWCLGDDYVSRPDESILCSPDENWELYEFVSAAYNKELEKLARECILP